MKPRHTRRGSVTLVIAMFAALLALSGCGNVSTPTDRAAEASASPSPSATNTMVPADYVGWDHIVAEPPEGLKAAIDDAQDQLGWSWDDAENWASQRSPKGNAWDARVVLVFGQDDLSASEARKAAGVDTDGVPVVRVNGCEAITDDECPVSGVEAILAPLTESGGLSIDGLGVVMLAEGYPLVTVTGSPVADEG